MRILKESIIVAFAFVGVVVGAGFATGQEIFQFFTSHGVYSISGIIVTGLLITLGGMIVMHTGHHLKSRNHSDSINYFLYPSIARGFDIILTMFMLSLAIIMTAGGASTIHQSFNLPYWLSATHISRLYFSNTVSKIRSFNCCAWRCYPIFNCDCHYDCGLLFHNESS